MKVIDVNQKISSALDQLIVDLERGRSQMLVDYLATMSRFHRYSWGNVLLIASQCPHATRVAGLRAWNKVNRFVRRGEKGIVILAPMVFRKKPEQPPFEPTGAYAEPRPRQGVRFKAVYVFDLSQTDGEPLPEVPTMHGDPAGSLERLRGLVRAAGIILDYDATLYPEGVSEGGRIRLRAGQTPAEEFATLVHEFAHERLHRDKDRKEISRRVRELEAEAVAFVVCHAVGLDTGTASSDYIQLYGGDRDALTASLARVQSCTSEILRALADGDDAQSAGHPAESADLAAA